MKIDILSDLHTDYYFIYNNGVDEKSITNFYKNYCSNDSECLIVAGDLGHYNELNIEVLKILQKYFYKYIICVLGNHDYYLVNQKITNKFKSQGRIRAENLRMLINQNENMFCLDGNIIEINGIKFAGCDSWYDGSYIPKYWESQPIPSKQSWKNQMTLDFKYIKGIENYLELFEIEKKKIEMVYKDCDVMITHVNPSNLNEHLSPKYNKQQSNAFFCFDGEKYLKNGNIKYWIFGHTHDAIEYRYEEVMCICHPLGAPNEDNGSSELIKTIEINS